MIEKSDGVTKTEQLLAEFCEKTFLKLWSYSNPYKDDGHELCDLLAVFGKYVFIFFDRDSELPTLEAMDKPKEVLWNRWKRNVIDSQVKTAHGAERYIRSGRPIYLDGKKTIPFPLEIAPEKIVVHKIVVAHGAMEACKKDSSQNVYGSLAVSYLKTNGDSIWPFHVEIDKHNPVHIFDSHNLPIVLTELDTVTDFAAYLDEKLRAISKYQMVTYCGEEDLLGHYLLNFDKTSGRHIIGVKDEDKEINAIMIGEGEWHDFIKTDVYLNTKKEDRISYLWDNLIQSTCQNAIKGTLGGNSDIFKGKSAIYEMVKEPRFVRRGLSEKMLNAISKFPDYPDRITRHVAFLPSFQPNTGYVFLQLRTPESYKNMEIPYREFRQKLLEIACGAAKNKFPHIKKVIGIGIDAPKFSGGKNSEDFILFPCENWDKETRTYYENLNEDFNFFKTKHLRWHKENLTQFVQPVKIAKPKEVRSKIGRNDLCPCGSGKKYKKCHGK